MMFAVVFKIFSRYWLYELTIYIYLSRWFCTIYTAVGADRSVIVKPEENKSVFVIIDVASSA